MRVRRKRNCGWGSLAIVPNASDRIQRGKEVCICSENGLISHHENIHKVLEFVSMR